MPQLTRRTLILGSAGLAVSACTTAEQEALLGEILGTGGITGGLSQAEAAAGIRAALDMPLAHQR